MFECRPIREGMTFVQPASERGSLSIYLYVGMRRRKDRGHGPPLVAAGGRMTRFDRIELEGSIGGSILIEEEGLGLSFWVDTPRGSTAPPFTHICRRG